MRHDRTFNRRTNRPAEPPRIPVVTFFPGMADLDWRAMRDLEVRPLDLQAERAVRSEPFVYVYDSRYIPDEERYWLDPSEWVDPWPSIEIDISGSEVRDLLDITKPADFVSKIARLVNLVWRSYVIHSQDRKFLSSQCMARAQALQVVEKLAETCKCGDGGSYPVPQLIVTEDTLTVMIDTCCVWSNETHYLPELRVANCMAVYRQYLADRTSICSEYYRGRTRPPGGSKAEAGGLSTDDGGAPEAPGESGAGAA